MIRNAANRDIQPMLELYTYYVLNSCVTFEYEVPAAQEFAQRVQDVQEQRPWLVCDIGGRVAGYAYAGQAFKRVAYQWNAEISIYVHEDFQGKGVAGALYECLEEILLQQGYYYLYVVVTADNLRSLALVHKYGFAKTGFYESAGYKLGQWIDVIWLTKQIKIPGGKPLPPTAYNELPQGCAERILARHQI